MVVFTQTKEVIQMILEHCLLRIQNAVALIE